MPVIFADSHEILTLCAIFQIQKNLYNLKSWVEIINFIPLASYHVPL